MAGYAVLAPENALHGQMGAEYAQLRDFKLKTNLALKKDSARLSGAQDGNHCRRSGRSSIAYRYSIEVIPSITPLFPTSRYGETVALICC